MLRLARYLLVPFLVGAISLGAAWAGVATAPAPEVTPEGVAAATQKANVAKGEASRVAIKRAQTGGVAKGASATAAAAGQQADAAISALMAAPASGQVLAGAAKVNIAPQPDASKGEKWAKEGCAILGDDAPSGATHVANFRSPWPENPSCIYMGGYGLGPMNPITSFDQEYGLWVRSVAIGDGKDTPSSSPSWTARATSGTTTGSATTAAHSSCRVTWAPSWASTRQASCSRRRTATPPRTSSAAGAACPTGT